MGPPPPPNIRPYRLARVTGPSHFGRMSDPSRALRVDVYSDYTCPWCYVGWARFERAKAMLPGDVEVESHWHPLEIHPEVPEGGMPFSGLGYPPDRWEAMQAALREAAAGEGIDVGARPFVSNTHRALMAGAYAQAEVPGLFASFHEGLFRTYFTEGQDLGDPAVVDRVAVAAGLEVAELNEALGSGRYEQVLSETGRRAAAMGVASTPTFVFAGRYVAVGAQPARTLARAMEELGRVAAG